MAGAGLPRGGRWLVTGLCVAACAALAGCGGGSTTLASSTANSNASLTSRFSQLFGSTSQPAGETSNRTQVTQNQQAMDLGCPPVAIRSGASTMAVGLPGKPAAGSDLRYQLTIARTARDCRLEGGQIVARIGVEGRILVGPAGAPPNIEIPLRVAVVEEQVNEKIIMTKLFRIPANVTSDNGSWTYVAEDIAYPVPTPADAHDNYIFYIGFDPNAAKSQPAKPARRAKTQG